MKFYKDGEIIKFKNSKKTIELKPTYSTSDSTNDSVRASWNYRYNRFRYIEKDQEKEDDLETINDSKEYLKEQMSASIGAILAQLFVDFVAIFNHSKLGIAGLETNGITFSSIINLVFTTAFLTGFGVYTVKTMAEFIHQIHSYRKLKKIEKKIQNVSKELENSKINNKEEKVEKINTIQKSKEKTVSDKLEEKSKSDINIEKPKKREIKYKETLITVENGKEVRKEIIKTTMHSPRYEGFKEFMIRSGASPELFELEAINDIIDYVIEYGDPVVMAEGRSPICYNYPNKDGTFNIYGRMGGYTVSLVYKMEYCNDGDPEHFIKLTKYKMNDGVLLKYDEGNDEIFINKEGNLVSGEIDVKSVNKKRFFIRYTDK